ncbi:MAG TPA: glycosyltransferase family 4 protein, partial [Vicinamibacterales bacterium]|nr:glycosyltransferase family 4 protein [Vicinamibacterales bacterium]
MSRRVNVTPNPFFGELEILNVLHLAAGNRWTGAAALAFAEVEALRAAGVEAHFGYVGGYLLEEKIGNIAFAHPVIEKPQNPASFRRTTSAVRKLIDALKIDVVHAHTTYDYWLAHFAAGRAHVSRTFHARRILRSDPITRYGVARTAGLFVVNKAFLDAPLLRRRRPVFTPPPLDERQFHSKGPHVRAAYGVAAADVLVIVIGKLSADRGFEAAIETLAELKARRAGVRLMIVGRGEHRPILEEQARGLGVADAVIWAGYHEEDLAEHYRAADVLLFTAKGSDEGHRAVIEAMACGTPAVTYPIEGVDALLGDLAPRLIAPEASPASLAATVDAILAEDRGVLRDLTAARTAVFGYAP